MLHNLQNKSEARGFAHFYAPIEQLQPFRIVDWRSSNVLLFVQQSFWLHIYRYRCSAQVFQEEAIDHFEIQKFSSSFLEANM